MEKTPWTDALAHAIAEGLRGIALPAPPTTELPRSTTLARFLDWQRSRKTPHSFATDACYLRRFFARVPVEDLNQLTPQLVTDYLTRRSLEDALTPCTLNRIREVLHTLFEWLKDQDLIARNPISRVRRHAIPAPAIRYLTLREIDELLDLLAKDAHLVRVAAVLVFAGLRRGEAIALRWDDVDLERGLILVRAHDDWQPKTKRNRSVPIHSRLRPFLESAPRRALWVLPSPRGLQWQTANLTHRFARRMKAADRSWRILDLRHTFGTQLVMRGVSLAKVAALMGNSPEICRRHYAHVATEELHRDVEF